MKSMLKATTGRGAFRSHGLMAIVVGLVVVGGPIRAHAVDFQGTVSFQGAVVFAAPIGGIDAQDLEVDIRSTTEATDPPVKCSILSTTSGNPDALGAYPDGGSVTAEILMERGGPQDPEGACIVTVEAAGTDGVSVSARGFQTVFVTANDIDTGATVAVDDLTVRESKAVAGLEKDCRKWVKKQLKKRARCNFILLRLGSAAAEKCKDGGIEPAGCDPGDHVEAILALGHGQTDQQTNPLFAQAVDYADLRDQAKCQKNVGKAAVNFAVKRINRVNKRCIEAGEDSEACRETESKESKRKLDKIDKCVGDQMVDGLSGLSVPDVDPPCDVCIDGAGVIDRKCLKDCFQLAVDALTDGIMGDTPVCGNGILQPPEVCDDGNVSNGDCCSSTCTAENLGDQMCGVGVCEVTVPVCQGGEPFVCVPDPAGTEGPLGDDTCTDSLDNDCDGTTDAGDTDCQ